jgi:hypothetical protein
MHGDLRLHALHGPIEALADVVGGAVIHAVMRLVDLDEVGADGDQRPALGVDDGDEIGEQRVPGAIAAAELQRHEQRVGTGHGGLDRLARQLAGELELLHDPEPLRRGDLLHDLERRVGVPERLAQAPGRRQGADTVEAIVEADDEADPHHLAGGDDVDPRPLLVEQRDLRGVLHELAHVRGTQPPRLHRLAREPHPAGQPVAAHDGGRQRRQHLCHRSGPF